MSSLFNRIYHLVHTTGWMADLACSLGYQVKHVLARLNQYLASTIRKVQPDETWRVRHLVPTSTLMVNVTNICNAKCTFCAYPKAVAANTLQRGVMPMGLFKKAVDEWAAARGEAVDLTPVVGDPLVDGNLMEKIRYLVHEAKIPHVVLTTNGILLNRNETYKQLIDSGIDTIYISTQGTDKAAYEQIYGVDQYEDVITGVANLMAYNQSRGEPVTIAIRFRNSQKPSEIINSADFARYIHPYLSDKVRVNFTVDYDNWGGTIKETDMHGVMRLRKPPAKVQVPCGGLFGFAVRHDGSVRLCGCRFKTNDLDDLVVGNLKEQTLEEISKGPRAWEIIEGFYQGKRPETCVGCTFYNPITRDWLKHRLAIAGASTLAPDSRPMPAESTPLPQPAVTTRS
jgi:MoaA/NifB/PqqE/SkfB family radical SAM enzyme